MSTRYRVVENFRMLAILRTPLLSGAASRALVVAAVLGCAVASIMPGASMASTGALATHNEAPELVSVAMDGTAAGGVTDESGVSATGRFVVFVSTASDLVPGDTNGASDVFVRDRTLKTTTRVSVASDGAQTVPAFPALPDSSFVPRISANGSEVVFASWANNLFPWPTGGGAGCTPWCPGELGTHFYVHYMTTGETRMIDTSATGSPANDDTVPQGAQIVLSGNGRYAAFGSNATNLVPFAGEGHEPQVYVKDLKTGAIERASVSSSGQAFNEPPGVGAPLAISNNGKIVVFQSTLPLDPSEPTDSVFVRNRKTRTTTGFAMYSELGAVPQPLSSDGRVYAAFVSGGTTLAWELDGTPPLTPTPLPSVKGPPLTNSDGSVLYFVSETDVAGDGLGPGIFAYNRLTGITSRSTLISCFALQAATRQGTLFVGLRREGPSEPCGAGELNVYAQAKRRSGA